MSELSRRELAEARRSGLRIIGAFVAGFIVGAFVLDAMYGRQAGELRAAWADDRTVAIQKLDLLTAKADEILAALERLEAGGAP